MLGLTLTRTGATSYIKKRINMATIQSSKIKRFIKLDPKVKLHLYKALIRPLMEYPIIPNGIKSLDHIKNMQRVQNKILKFAAAYSDQSNKTAEELHLHYNIDPMIVRMYDAVEKLWTKMEIKEPEIHQKSTEENNYIFADHAWWKRAALFLENPRPDPTYVYH